MQVFHGTIVTCDPDSHVCRYLVEDQGRIRFVGDELPQEYARSAPIELGARALLPAFGDGHLHFSNWALVASAFVDVREAADLEELGQILRRFAARDTKAKVLTAFGASKHSVAEKRLITRSELDQVIADRPLYVICYDGHSAIINSRMLEMIPDELRETRGFNVDTGQLFHEAYYRATDFITNLVPPLTLVNSIIAGFDRLTALGVGLIHTVEGIGFPRDLDVTLVNLIARARAHRDGFQTRLFFQTLEVDKVLRRGFPRIGGCFATALDGCFGVCDAALNQPYTHQPENKGILFYSDEQVIRFAKEANRAGLQIELHTIGDAAIDQAIKALAAALGDHPRDDHRHTIIHACLLSEENIERCATLGIGVTLQPGFLTSPLEPASYLEEILGERVKTSSPLRSLIDRGVHLSGGSDAPVTPPDPISGIHGACNHPYDPKQSLTVQQALKMYTYEVAWTSFDEEQRGSLEAGKIADMVILNQDPLALPPERLLELKAEELYLSGRKRRPGMGLASMLWNALAGRKIRS